MDVRPTTVPGPFGPLTIDDLPPTNTQRWVSRRKAEIIAAIECGLIDRSEVRRRYSVSDEELKLWERSIAAAGVPGLRTTRIQIYRPAFEAMDKKPEFLKEAA